MYKNGSGYDLPIDLGIIAASGQKELPGIGKYLVMGELGLDGSIREVPGALPFADLAAGREGLGASCLSGLPWKRLSAAGSRYSGWRHSPTSSVSSRSRRTAAIFWSGIQGSTTNLSAMPLGRRSRLHPRFLISRIS